MAVSEHLTYTRDFLRLDYPVEWIVRENRPVGVTEFYHPVAHTAAYPPGVALMTIPETGMALESLLRTGVFFLTRDLHGPTIERLGEQQDNDLTWHRVLVRGRAPGPAARAGVTGPPATMPAHLDIVKRVALARPGPGVLVLALFGPADALAPLEGVFEDVRRSVRIVR